MTIKYPELSEKEFLSKYLQIVNVLLPEEQQLIPSEIELVIEFAILPEEKFKYQRFGSLAKNRVIEAFKLKDKIYSKVNINNKLYSLIDKKFIIRDEDSIMYLPKHLLTSLSKFRKDKTYTIDIVFSNGDNKDQGDSK